MLKVPNSSSSSFAGKFLVGDVGSSEAEEINLVSQGGLNFGWPNYEGMEFQHINRPNTPPSINEKPVIAMRDYISGKTNVNPYFAYAGSAQLPGDSIPGNAAVILGDFYQGNQFGLAYQNTLFFGDMISKNIYNVKFDANFNPLYINKFENTGKNILGIKISPINGSLYYIAKSQPYDVVSEIRKIKYTSTNISPVAKIEVDKENGPAKLTVGFSAKYSYDPDGSGLTYAWAFSDGQTAAGLSPFVTFDAGSTNFNIITATLIVTDSLGASAQAVKTIQLNNQKPKIINVSSSPAIPDNIISGQIYTGVYSAIAEDENPSTLSYKWETYEMHNGHEHLNATLTTNNASVPLALTICESGMASYWAKVKLIVTDEHNLSASQEFIYTPDCGLQLNSISFAPIPNQTSSQTGVALNASSSVGLPISYYPIEGYVALTGSSLMFEGIPSKITVRAAQHGDLTYNQALYKDITFDYVKNRLNQTISFNNINTQFEPLGNINLSATSTASLPIKYVWLSGPANVVANQVILTGEPGWVTIRAYNAGNDNINGGYEDRSFLVCKNQIDINANHQLTDEELTKIIFANNTINATSKVLENTKIIYNANNQINLLPGFKTAATATFEAKIMGCPN